MKKYQVTYGSNRAEYFNSKVEAIKWGKKFQAKALYEYNANDDRFKKIGVFQRVKN